MISANHDESSILEGLNVSKLSNQRFGMYFCDRSIPQMGSNDYVQKPFSRAQVTFQLKILLSDPSQPYLVCTQLVARIDTHLRSRDGWMAENKRSNDLLGQVHSLLSARCAMESPCL